MHAFDQSLLAKTSRSGSHYNKLNSLRKEWQPDRGKGKLTSEGRYDQTKRPRHPLSVIAQCQNS